MVEPRSSFLLPKSVSKNSHSEINVSTSTDGYDRQGFEQRAGNAVAFLCSLVFHIGLLVILACWFYTVGKPSKGLLLSADIGESTDTAFEISQAFELQPPASGQEQDLSEPEFSLDVSLDNVLDSPAAVPAPGGLAASLTSVSVDSVVDGLQLAGRGRGANFFGAYAEGNRFVYIVDSSRSMLERTSASGTRWTYARNRLIDSLNGLKPGQEFFVICFDSETTLLFGKSLRTAPKRIKFFEADDDTVTRVSRWLRGQTLGNSTLPADAFRYALALNPDVIFFLSDGELKDNSQMMLRMINGLSSERRQIPIHTVHLSSGRGVIERGAQEMLQAIARENSGTFTPVYGR